MSAPPERTAKRMKHEGGDPPPPEGYHGYGSMPPGGRYHQYGGPPMGPQSGYVGWQHGQYPSGGPPPSWAHSSGPPGSMYSQRGAPTPDRAGYASAYARGPPSGPDGRRPKTSSSSRGPPPKSADGAPADGPHGSYPPSSGWQGGHYAGYQHGPPPMYASGPPPAYGSYRAGHSPPRSRPRSSPEMISGYPGSGMISATENPEMEMYTSRGVGPDDDGSTGGGASSKDKGRGSYKCGRCGVPKKGHVCPYQPKLTRRPGEPLPEMRSAAVQVEMDEFMTLRRLNLKIQGFPESYATEPYMDDDMVVGEPHPPAMATQTTRAPPPPPHLTPDGNSITQSPIRSSPVVEDPVTA